MSETLLPTSHLGQFYDQNLVDSSSFNIGGVDLGGAASIAGVIGGLWSMNEDKKYKKEMLKREDARIDRERTRQDAFESSMKSAWGVV